ncbi:MAG: GPW/gp25 family protein [Thermodesulfovibrionales bacterium]|jgi:hypothetical protein
MTESDESGYSSFLGTGWAFPPAFSTIRKGVEMVSDEESIRTSLTILLSTAVGERLMEPRYGCNLQEMIFEPLTTTMKTYISGLVEQAILHFEPRIRLNGLALEPADEPGGRIDIIIDYTVRTTNSRFNMVYPFYLREAAGR